MPFRGPSSNGAFGFERAYGLERQAKMDEFDMAMQKAAGSRGQVQFIGDRDGAVPWVERGGSTLADAPALSRPRVTGRGATEQDAIAAAETQGMASVAGDQARVRALSQVPGITPQRAARMVFGRTGFEDDPDPASLRGVISEYVRAPSREAAARAIQAGASLNIFPDRFMAPDGMVSPVRGTPQYEDMLRREGQIEVDALRQAAPIRAEATASARAPARNRTQLRQLKDGTIVRVDLETGIAEPVSDSEGTVAMGPSRTSMLDQLLTQRQDSGGRGAPAPARTADTTSMAGSDSGERAAFSAAYSRLRARGARNITSAMVRAEMRNGRQ